LPCGEDLKRKKIISFGNPVIYFQPCILKSIVPIIIKQANATWQRISEKLIQNNRRKLCIININMNPMKLRNVYCLRQGFRKITFYKIATLNEIFQILFVLSRLK